jgi:hypothetical protein
MMAWGWVMAIVTVQQKAAFTAPSFFRYRQQATDELGGVVTWVKVMSTDQSSGQTRDGVALVPWES